VLLRLPVLNIELVIPTELFGIPVWFLLFVAAGFLLFLFKIASSSPNDEKLSKFRLFLIIATVLFALAGIADFVVWATPTL
jgi:hypothetical protein